MSEFAQLPTPTIATRTLPSSIKWPLPAALSCDPFSVVISGSPSLRRGGASYYAALAYGLHLWDVQRLQLPPYVPHALHDCDRRKRRHSVDGRRKQLNIEEPSALREHQADGQDHYPDGPRCNPDLALHTQRLGPGARVRDHQRAEHSKHACSCGDRVARIREVPGDGRDHDTLLDPIEGRIEERAEERSLAGHARVPAVERVHHGADDERNSAEDEQALGHEDRRGKVQDQTRKRDSVRCEPRLDQPAAGVGPELLARTNIAKLATRNLRRHGGDATAKTDATGARPRSGGRLVDGLAPGPGIGAQPGKLMRGDGRQAGDHGTNRRIEPE